MRGNPVLAAMVGVAFEDEQVHARLVLTDSAVELHAAWSDLDIRASSRELWGPCAGKHRGRIWIALSDGWWAIRLISGDDERMARGVMRHVIDCVGRSRTLLESRLVQLDRRYRIESVAQPDHDAGSSPFDDLSGEGRLEALLALRSFIIEVTQLDDLDEGLTVIEALREQAQEASGDERERLRHACAFELAVGRFLGAEALNCSDTRSRAVRRARMREAFDAACKAFSRFAEFASSHNSAPSTLEVRLCSVGG